MCVVVDRVDRWQAILERCLRDLLQLLHEESVAKQHNGMGVRENAGPSDPGREQRRCDGRRLRISGCWRRTIAQRTAALVA